MKQESANLRVTVLLIAGLLSYASVSLFSAAQELREAEALTAELQSKIRLAESENRELRQKTEDVDSDDAVRERAEEIFHLTDPETVIFTDGG